MQVHITTTEAKKQKLPGSDVFRYSHLLYLDDLNRDCGVIKLNLEALKAFSDTVTLGKRHEMAAEQAEVGKWIAQGGIVSKSPFPLGAAFRARMEFINYEHLKIASGFELHLKARLLANNYVLHDIDAKLTPYKTLASEQLDRPIEKHELFAIESYLFDGKQNYLPGVKDSSLKFSWLTDKSNYKVTLGLIDQQLDIIRDYRLLRNQIHFPGDFIEAPNIQGFGKPIDEFLIDFINTEIIAWSNLLIAKHKLNFRLVAPLV